MDGLRRRIPTRHSIVLCFLFGPIGLLSHLLTDQLIERSRQRSADEAAQASALKSLGLEA